MRRLICVFVVHICHKQVFSWRGSFSMLNSIHPFFSFFLCWFWFEGPSKLFHSDQIDETKAEDLKRKAPGILLSHMSEAAWTRVSTALQQSLNQTAIHTRLRMLDITSFKKEDRNGPKSREPFQASDTVRNTVRKYRKQMSPTSQTSLWWQFQSWSCDLEN